MNRQLLACFVLIASASPAWAIADADYYRAVAAAAQNQITPAYRGLKDTVAQLSPALQKLCGDPTEVNLKTAQQAFHLAAIFWARVQFFSSGPVSEHQRAVRIEYWPDKRNVVGRQLNDVLAKRDPAALEPQRFATTSVGVQGLPALERLLFDDDALANLAAAAPGRDFRCKLLAAIGGNLDEITDDLLDWTPGQRRFLGEPAPSSLEEAPVTGRDAAARLLNDLLTAAIVIRDMKVLAPLGDSLGKAKPQAAEYWRSRLSLGTLHANLTELRDTLAAEGGLADLLAQQAGGLQASRAVVDTIDEALRITTQIGASEPDQTGLSLVSLSDAVVDPDRRRLVEALAQELAKIRDLLAGPVATKLNLPIGFNALDGD
jgi:predicted lipoprotein